MQSVDNLFESSMGKLKDLQTSILGEDYNYGAKLYNPRQIGMSDKGDLDTLASDIGGLLGYVQVLTEGGGPAQKTTRPLGDKFFLPTAAKCKDIKSQTEQTRSLYINNQADGTIPFISEGMGVTFSQFKGLVPGILSNVSRINPFQMLQSFMIGKMPECQMIAMETINNSDMSNYSTGYVLTNDIKNMNACWFPYRTNPVTGQTCNETFTTLGDKRAMQTPMQTPMQSPTQSSKTSAADMPNDWLVRLYYSSLGLLGLYIFLKMFKKKVV
jgi:hypothetical protein